MNRKILKIGNSSNYYSYKDIYSYRNKEILGPLNESADKKGNVVYCLCNGKNESRAIKMHTRKNESKTYYSLATNDKKKQKHNVSCPKYDEIKFKKELISKGRVYPNIDNGINLELEKNSISPKEERYSLLYGIGEMLLAMSNNAYIDARNKIGKEHDVLSYLYRYYEKGSSQSIITYLNDIVVNTNLGITLGQVIFNPKWIKCDKHEDKTSAVVKSYMQMNKKYKSEKGPLLQYVLLKYSGYTVINDKQVKIEMSVRGKNTKENFNKKIFMNMDKFKFFKALNMYKVEDKQHKAEYFVSTLVYADNGKLIAKDIAFIPVYPEYCIPVDTINEIKLLSQLLVWRNKLSIKKIAKMANFLEYGNSIPDMIVSVKGKDAPILIEFFDYILPEYYNETLSKTLCYEELSRQGKCEFLGFYNNLGWGSPPLEVILYANFKTIDNIGDKVKYSIDKALNKHGRQ